MNMRVLRKSRKPPKAGEIFAFQVRDSEFMFGRVIKVDARIVSMRDVIMIYIYNARSPAKEDIPVLDRRELLIPPQFTNRLPWSFGYFETVAQGALTDDDVLRKHCFAVPALFLGGKETYFDEYNNRLTRRSEPCGVHALGSYGALDDEVSRALGIPSAPD